MENIILSADKLSEMVDQLESLNADLEEEAMLQEQDGAREARSFAAAAKKAGDAADIIRRLVEKSAD